MAQHPLAPPGSTTDLHAHTVLVLAPHYDDEILGCGGLLAKLLAVPVDSSQTVDLTGLDPDDVHPEDVDPDDVDPEDVDPEDVDPDESDSSKDSTSSAGRADVHVLFLTDSAGGVEEVEDRREYPRTRQQEAQRVAELFGFTSVEHLSLPDGALHHHLPELRRALRAALVQHRPDLLLVTSPLEITVDHQTAFAAVHDVLGGLRPATRSEGLNEEELYDIASQLRVLAYDVNHPLHPNVLVDVSAQRPVLERAMEFYASQQQRHDYLSACLGLQQYRALSLGPDVEGAEGYVRLTLDDFVTRSPAQLIEHLGGVARLHEVREGPSISVIVRTHDRPALLAEALESLARSTYRNAEILVVNDGGARPELPEASPLPLRLVDLETNQGRAGAAAAGVEAATGDYVTFLDDDDLAAPEHLATLAQLVRSAGVRVAYTDAAVAVYQLQEVPASSDETGGIDAERESVASSSDVGWRCVERRLPYSRDFDHDLLRVDNYIPFNTLIFERELLQSLDPILDPELPFFEDWDLLLRLAEKTPFQHLARVTCEYRHFSGGGHHIFGQSPRQRADFLDVKARVLTKHARDRSLEELARTWASAVDTLRAEAVMRGEEARTRGRELRTARSDVAELKSALDQRDRAYFDLERRHVELNGEVDALRQEHRRLRVAFDEHGEEIVRLQGEEKRLEAERVRLEAAVEKQSSQLGATYAEIERLQRELNDHAEHLGRTYAEIARLNGLIEAMQQTRAWRLHSWVEQRRGGGGGA